jgi:hypothetical protein
MGEGNSSCLKEKQGIQVDIRVLWVIIRKHAEYNRDNVLAASIELKAPVHSQLHVFEVLALCSGPVPP